MSSEPHAEHSQLVSLRLILTFIVDYKFNKASIIKSIYQTLFPDIKCSNSKLNKTKIQNLNLSFCRGDNRASIMHL